MSAADFLPALLAYVFQGTAVPAAGALFLGLLRPRDPFFRLACLEALFWSSPVLPLVLPWLRSLRSPAFVPSGDDFAATFAAATARLPEALP